MRTRWSATVARADPALLVAAVLVVAACSSPGRGAGGHADAADAADARVPVEASSGLWPSQLPADFHCEPTLTSVRTSIFEHSCGWDTCHGNNDAAWGVRLVDDDTRVHDGLVDSLAGGCRGWTLVVPGDPERSFLWNKLSEPRPACGEPMPRGIVQLPPEALECVRGWILSL